jgi:O-antigen biosynthesis protein
MSLSHLSVAVRTLNELLFYHDEHFVQSAFLTVLNREPDDEGMRFYLASVRAGVGKMEILSQLYASSEGRERQRKLEALNDAIETYQRSKAPLLGPIRRVVSTHSDSAVSAAEGALYALEPRVKERFIVPEEQFVHCAYHALLARPPDLHGLRSYIQSIQNRVAKVEILAQIKASEEGKSRTAEIARMNQAIRRHRQMQLPLLGIILRLLGKKAPERAQIEHLRAMENSMHLLIKSQAGMPHNLRTFEAKLVSLERSSISTQQNLSVIVNKLDAHYASAQQHAARISRILQAVELKEVSLSPATQIESYDSEAVTPDEPTNQNGEVISSQVGTTMKSHSATTNKRSNQQDTTRLISFDKEWYLGQYPEVKTCGLDPEEHYTLYGKQQGFHPYFDESWYLSEYPDVAHSGVGPREHYLAYGKEDGRHPRFDADWYLIRYPDVAASGLEPLEHYIKYGKGEERFPAFSEFSADGNNYSKWIRDFDTLTDADTAMMIAQTSRFLFQPLISIILPVYNPNPAWLKEAIDSVRNQIYPNWELCIADDASPNPDIRVILKEYSQLDSRIKVELRKENGHISAASNSALGIARGLWVALLDHDDTLPSHALYCVVESINKDSSIRLIYSDEDKINEKSQRFGPYFKCDWNPDLFYSHNMFSHLGVYAMDLIREVGGFRLGFEGSQDYDLALRCIERIEQNQIHHIPRVLYHWRMHAESTASSADAKPYAMLAGERAINDHLVRKGVNAKAELKAFGYRVHYQLPTSLPLVSIIIPTKNGLELLKRCINSIFEKTEYTNYEILIIDNGSDELATLEYLQLISRKPNVRVLHDARPFNYSQLNNGAVRVARGEVICLLNNDIEVISSGWLSELVSHALRPDVGAVGAKLLFPDDTIQHAGILLKVTGIAAHAHKGFPRNAHGYFSRANLIQDFSAVTGACLVVKKSLYQYVGGLNETELAVAFNDVDFCMRIREAGYRNIWTPYAELYHHESATRGYEDSPEKAARFEKEVEYMERRLENQEDPFYSPNLTKAGSDFSLAWPPRVKLLSTDRSSTQFKN